MQEGNKDRTAKGSSGARARVCWSRGLCPWALRTQVTPSASWAWGQRVRWERRVRCTWGFPGTPLVSAERSSPCPPPADAETREQKVMEPSFSPSPGFSDLSASFTAFAMHGILELEHLSQTHRHFTVFESQDLSIWSLSRNPRILESQEHSRTHGTRATELRSLWRKPGTSSPAYWTLGIIA